MPIRIISVIRVPFFGFYQSKFEFANSIYFARKPFLSQRENSKAPRYTPIKHLGQLSFSGYRFGVNSLQKAGAGRLGRFCRLTRSKKSLPERFRMTKVFYH